MRDKYFCNDLSESMLSWISFERKNYVENVRDFRFAKFLIDHQKCDCIRSFIKLFCIDQTMGNLTNSSGF